jgi:hypothetical protein
VTIVDQLTFKGAVVGVADDELAGSRMRDREIGNAAGVLERLAANVSPPVQD